MRLNAITFKETEDGPEPDTVTVTLTVRQVAWLLVTNGGSDLDAERIMPGFARESSEIYQGLAFGVANPYFEHGDEELIRKARQTPREDS